MILKLCLYSFVFYHLRKMEGMKRTQLLVSSDSSRIITTFNPPLVFPERCSYEMALTRLETYYSSANITETNNKLKISFDGGKVWTDIEIPVGCYEIYAINKTLQRLIVAAGGKPSLIIFSPNRNTLKCVLEIKDAKYIVDFTGQNCIRTLLGFDAGRYIFGRTEGQSIVNIMDVNSILVKCDVIGSSTLNGVAEPIIYSFFPNVSPGCKIVEIAHNLTFLPLSTNTISTMTCWLTDQNNKELNLRGEKLTISLIIQPC